MESLLIWNWVLFLIHAILGIGLLIYFKTRENDGTNIDFSLYDIDIDYDNKQDPEVCATKVVNNTTETVEYLIVAFFLITALFHLFYATNGFGTGVYLEAVENGNNYFRWIEYSISATIMIIIINLISGVKSIDANLLATISSLVVMLQGNSVEVSLQRKDGNKDYVIPTITGWLLLGGIFFVVIRNFFIRLQEVNDAGFTIPSWLPAIIFPIILWYLSFGFVQLHQIIVGSYYRGYEYAYLFLSLTSKAFLGIYLAYGLTQREQENS